MYIHFAFGQLGREGRETEQTQQLIEKILIPRQLKTSKCVEFLPVWPDPINTDWRIDVAKMAKLNSQKLDEDDVLEFVETTRTDATVIYLPVPVQMVCFIDIALRKLKNSPHRFSYGKLGLAFTKNFYSRVEAKHVRYYTESSLRNDAKIAEYNCNKGQSGPSNRKLEIEIAHYRKPAKLFENFQKSIVQIIRKHSNVVKTSEFTYDRYPPDYDFTAENEVRCAVSDDSNYVRQIDGEFYLPFDEEELYCVIVPDGSVGEALSRFFEQSWKARPAISVFP